MTAVNISASAPVVGVGAVIWNGRGELVLIRRAKPPRLDEWSIPGGHLEWGESLKDAVVREVLEETGLAIDIVGLIDVVDSVSRNDAGAVVCHYVLIDFAARAIGGELHAASDAREARWVPYAQLGEFNLWSETRRIIDASALMLEKAAR